MSEESGGVGALRRPRLLRLGSHGSYSGRTSTSVGGKRGGIFQGARFLLPMFFYFLANHSFSYNGDFTDVVSNGGGGNNDMVGGA